MALTRGQMKSNWKKEKEKRAIATRDDYVGGFMSFLNKISGAGWTDAERATNEFNAEQAELQRQWAEDMYERHNTISAQRKQWEDAGFNPAMAMTNGNAVQPAPTSSSAAQGVSPSSNPSFLISLLSTIIGAAQTKRQNEIAQQNADTNRIAAVAGARKDNAAAEGQEIQNYISDNTKDIEITLKGLNVEQAKANIANIRQNTEESKERIEQIRATVNELNAQISLMASEEALNYKRIEYTDKQIEDLTQLIDVHRLNKEQLEAFKPYWARMAAAELALTNAKTDEAKAIAASTYKDAALKAYDLMVQDGIVEGFEKYTDRNGFMDWNKMKEENPRAFTILYGIYKDADIKAAQEKETTARANSARSTRWGQNVSFVLESLSSVLGTVFQGMQAYGIYKGGKGVADRGEKPNDREFGPGSPPPINRDSYSGYRPDYNTTTSQYYR